MNHLSSRWLKSTPLKTAVLQSKVTRADWKVLTLENCSLAIKGNNLSASSSLLLKFGSLKTLRRATISRRPSTCMWVHLQVYLMLPLRISGTTSRQACSIQLRKCVAQLSPSVGVVKPGGGKRMWKRPLLPSRKLSRPGRLLKALGHHNFMMQPMHCQTCSAPCQSRSWQEGLWEYCPKSSEVYHLDKQFRREDADVIADKPVKNDAGKTSMSEDFKQKAWLEHSQRHPNIQFNWNPDHLSDKHHWKAHPSQSPLIWLR